MALLLERLDGSRSESSRVVLPLELRSSRLMRPQAPATAGVALMARVALLTVSDGREGVHRDIEGFAASVERRIAAVLEQAGHHVVCAQELVWTNELAVREARRLAAEQPDLTIINIPVWAFPHFTVQGRARAARTAAAVLEHRSAVPRAWSECSRQPGPSIRSAVPSDAPGVTSVIPRRSRRSSSRSVPPQPCSLCGGRRSAGSAAAPWACTPPSPTAIAGFPSSASTSRRSINGRSSAGRPRSTTRPSPRLGTGSNDMRPASTTTATD